MPFYTRMCLHGCYNCWVQIGCYTVSIMFVNHAISADSGYNSELLQRRKGQFTPGGWCVGNSSTDPCAVTGDPTVLRPGAGARRLEELVVKLLAPDQFRSRQCAAFWSVRHCTIECIACTPGLCQSTDVEHQLIVAGTALRNEKDNMGFEPRTLRIFLSVM